MASSTTTYILIVILFACLVQALEFEQQQQQQQQAAVCNTFRITSPVIENLHWTAGQCYQVSYDLGGGGDNEGGSNQITVDLVNSDTNQAVTLVNAERVEGSGGTNPFSLNATTTGTYHYSVILIHNNVRCEPKKTVNFQVTVNPHSPPTFC